ncbi:cAMP-dependent protein kinase inhibitor alpha [Grus japonensis]|uniref:cAMP-dependent protein kinase inhibitor alpha n=1 Tax=Grus japonensis TaxID=30415 RepID=A0ABC9WPF8_GRUJA
MQCFPSLVLALSSLLGALALLQLSLYLRVPSRYGKHEERLCRPRGRLPARCAWFLQELPSFLVPALLLALRSPPRLEPLGCRLLCCLFCWHYFYSTLFTHIELVVHQDHQVLFHKAALKPDGPQPVLHSWIMFSQVQDLTLVLVELHKVLVSPLFQPIQIFLQGGSPFRSVHFLTRFRIISKLHQGTLDPIIQITYEDTKQCWAQY